MLRKTRHGTTSYWTIKSHDRERQIDNAIYEVANIGKEGRYWKDT